jgi:outer membrane autotransporter protein
VLGGVRRDSSSGSGPSTGRSGNIAVNNSGVISASGENAVALLFQNASGGAYLYQNPDGTVSAVSSAPDSDSSRAGEVVVTNTGVIQSTGVGGIGITKSTNANDTHGNLRVENAEGATIQGGAGGAAIVLVTDQVERVINRGSIIAGDKGRAMALEGVGGNDYVRNYGTIAGNIAIPGALTDFYNAPTGRIEAQFIDLDEQSIVLNAGTISPNGPYRLGTLDIWADYIQTSTGNYEADLVLRSGVTDQLNAAAATSIDGTVTLLPNQVGQAKPGSFTSQGIIDTAAGISLDGLELVAPISAVADFSMRLIEGGRDLAFDYSVDYAPKGLSPNSTQVGKAINKIQAAGSTSKFEPTAALVFYDETVSELDDTYRQLSGEALTAFSQVAIDAAQNFQIAVNNNLDEVALNPEARCLAEQQQAPRQPTGLGDQPKQQPAPAVAPCGTWRGWALMSGYDASTPGKGSSDQASYDTTAFGTTIGADALVRPGTLVGAAARWDNLWTTASSLGTSGVTTGWSGMLYAKQALGPETRLTAMLGAGSYSADIRRNLSLSAPATEQSTVNATGYSAQLGVSHRVPIGRASLTPKLGISWLQLKQPGFSESTSSSGAAFQQPGNPLDPVPSPGKASYSLKVASETYTSVPLSFGVEFSQPIKKGSTTWIPRLGIGYSFDLANTQRNMNAQFTAAPGASFDVEGTPAPSQWWTVGLGLDVQLGDRVTLYGGALGQLSPGSTQSINYGGGFRWRF